MAKLTHLSSASLIFTDPGFHRVLRDIMRSETSKVTYGVVPTGAANTGASAFSGASTFDLVKLTGTLPASATTDHSHNISATKSGDRYNVGGTPGYAPTAYGDPNRTTFASFFDFIVQAAKNGALQDEIAADIGTGVTLNGLAIDQVNLRVHAHANASLEALTVASVYATFEPGESSGADFTE